MRSPTRTCLLLAGLLVAMAHPAVEARQTDQSVQTVSVAVRPIVALAVSEASGPLTTGAVMTWALSTNASGLDLVARLDSPLPSGLVLELSASSKLGRGHQSVRITSEEPTPIVSSIGQGREKQSRIELALVGNRTSGLVRTITFTLTDPATGTSDSVSRTIRIGFSPDAPSGQAFAADRP